jgi:hypothetical protein
MGRGVNTLRQSDLTRALKGAKAAGVRHRSDQAQKTQDRDRHDQRSGNCRAGDAGGQPMGRSTQMKIPRYVHGYIDRHGKELVPRAMRYGEPTALRVPRIAKGGLSSIGRGRMHAA